MYERHIHTVFALLGAASDREATTQYFEQAGYKAQIFKNPDVFFDELKFAKNPIVILETFALKCKLSEWVQALQTINRRVSWIVAAPINQYTIVTSYQNRGLVDFVQNDQPYLLERLLWAVDRQAQKEDIQLLHRQTQEELILSRKNQIMQKKNDEKIDDFSSYIKRKEPQGPYTMLALSLDDENEVLEFWGQEVLEKAHEILKDICTQKWGTQSVQTAEGRVYVTIPKTTEEVLNETIELQSELQAQGRHILGFRVSVSGGIAENHVHTNKVSDLRRLTEEALRHIQTKGGGKVGIPKAIRGGGNGDVPTNLGRN